MRISDWSSDLCSSDLLAADTGDAPARQVDGLGRAVEAARGAETVAEGRAEGDGAAMLRDQLQPGPRPQREALGRQVVDGDLAQHGGEARSEEHKPEIQSLMRISYAVFC